MALDTDDIGELFGEDQARFVLACGFEQAEALLGSAHRAGLQIAVVGRFGGAQVTFGAQSAALADLSTLYRSAFADAVT